MAVDTKLIEGRNYGVIPLIGGVDLQEAKALVLPGTLQDTLNYEVVSRGYTRAQGLLLYNGSYDRSVDNFWFIGDEPGNTTIVGPNTFTLGGEVTWATGSGTCIYWVLTVGSPLYTALGLVDIKGTPPTAADTFTDTETGTTFQVLANPATLETAVYPGTANLIAPDITAYLAFINGVNTTIAAQTSSTWDAFKPQPLGEGAITGGFQFKDSVYVARDHMGIGFDAGTAAPNVGDLIQISALPQYDAVCAGVDVQAGSWENNDAEGVIYLEPYSTGTNDVTAFNALPDNSQIYNNTVGANVATYDKGNNTNKGLLWKAGVNGWSLVDTGHGIRFKEGQNAPSAQVAPLFLPSIAGVTSSVLDTGWTFVANAAEVGIGASYAPWTNLANLYADDAAVATNTIGIGTYDFTKLVECYPAADYIPATDTEIIGVEVRLEAHQSVGTEIYINSIKLVNDGPDADPYESDNLTDRPNLTNTPAIYSFGGQTDLWGTTSLKAEDFNNGNVKIQVQFACANGTPARIVNVDYIQIKVHYIARGQKVYFWDGAFDRSTANIYSFETHDGDWVGTPEIPEVLAEGYVVLDTGAAGSVDGIVVNGIQIMSASVPFATDLETTATNVASNITANTSSPDYNATAAGTIITITAAAGSGSSPNGFVVTSTTTTITTTDYDMANGVDFEAEAVGNATGYMGLQNVSVPRLVVAGQEIRTAPSGGGTLVAVTAGDIYRNLLPSEVELAADKSMWEVIEANFFPNEEGKAIYGATGAGPAFMFDEDDHFALIRLPVAPRKDKPRHVAFQSNHLCLGLDSGHLLISAIDIPNDFDPVDGASTFSFRDPITGIVQLPGNALGVMCRESVHALIGTQNPVEGANDPFRPQNVTPNIGCIEYTLADVMGSMYADFNGVTTLETSDKFGDFAAGRLTVAIEDWTRNRLQNKPSTQLKETGAVMAVPVRAKNQYRLYFKDGYILNLYLGIPGQPAQPMFSHLDPSGLTDTYVPTWIDSTVLSTGKERIVMGDKNGNVWIVDGANGIQTAAGLQTVPCYITTNPVNTGYPQGSHKTLDFSIMGEFMGAQTITTSVGYDYLDVSSTPRTKVVGDYGAAPLFSKQPDLTNVYVDSFTDGTSLKIETSMDGSAPHTLHTLLHRFSRLGSGRNNTQVPR